MNIKRVFALTLIYFVLVTAAFVGVHLHELKIPDQQRAFADILMLVERHYVEKVDPTEVLFHTFDGLRSVVGEDNLSVEREGPLVTLRETDGPATTLAVGGSTRETAEIFYTGVDFLEKHFKNLGEREMETEGIRQSIKWLDPHSSYMTAQEYSDLMSETHGHFGGVGIEITVREERLTVIAPIEGTPAFLAGVKAGDEIHEIDGESTEGMDLYTAVSHIRGEVGTEVVLGIYRPGWSELHQIPVVRDQIHIDAIRWSVLDGGIGYIRINTFNDTTTDEIVAAFRDARQTARPTAWILDLRQCPGGLLAQAIGVADLFLDEGLVVYTDGRDPSQHREYRADSSSTLSEEPLIVLLGSSTASAAEIVAGALADHERALLIGARSWGKASVQSIFSLPDASALKLTTARYYTPNGTSIQARGITPHVKTIIRLDDGTEYDPMGEKDLEGVLKNESETKPRTPDLTVEAEKVYEYYKQRDMLDEDDFHAPDSLTFFARDVLLDSASGALVDLVAAARDRVAEVDLTELPPREAPPEPDPLAEEASPEGP